MTSWWVSELCKCVQCVLGSLNQPQKSYDQLLSLDIYFQRLDISKQWYDIYIWVSAIDLGHFESLQLQYHSRKDINNIIIWQSNCKSTFANYRRFKWHMNDNRGGVKLKSTLKTLPASAIWVLFKCSLSAFMISFLLQYDPHVYKHCTCQTKQCLQTFLPSRLPPTRFQLLDLENISFLKRTLLGWWSHCRTS